MIDGPDNLIKLNRMNDEKKSVKKKSGRTKSKQSRAASAGSVSWSAQTSTVLKTARDARLNKLMK
jgi:hypothetical protein